MITQSILNDKLKSFDYYKSKIPLYLQNSDGFIEHFKIWYDFLVNEVESSDIFLNLLLLFDPDYLTYLSNNVEDYSNNESDILDKLGAIFRSEERRVGK